MSQKFAAFDASGSITAFYDGSISPVPPGVSALPITDEQWKACNLSPGYTVVGGGLVAPSAVAPPTAAQVLAIAQSTQIALLSAACGAQIVAGQQSAALGDSHTYPSKVTDQQNLASSVIDSVMAKAEIAWAPNTVYSAGAIAVANGVPMKAISGGTSGTEAPAWPTQPDTVVNDNGVQWEMWTTPFWCEYQSGVWAWVDHSADQIQQVGRDIKQAILACQARNAMLAAQVAAAETVAAVQSITW